MLTLSRPVWQLEGTSRRSWRAYHERTLSIECGYVKDLVNAKKNPEILFFIVIFFNAVNQQILAITKFLPVKY